MRPFLKHTARSLREHPLQPLLIIAAISLCVCLCLSAIGLQGVFFVRSEQVENRKTALGDVVINLCGESQERMLFADDAKDMLGNTATVLGDYSLTTFSSEGTRSVVRVRATDLEQADRYLHFEFVAYGKFTQENIHSSVIISKEFAEKKGLSLLDSVTLEVLGQSVTYTVQAIARHDVYFYDCDVLCSTSSAVELLSKRSPLIASLGSDFAPSNRLLIRAAEGQDPQQIFETLSASSDFSDDYVELSGSTQLKNLNFLSKNVIVGVIALILTLLCGTVIVTAQDFLLMKREAEYALFEASGASFGQVAFLMLAEAGIYSLVGGIFGGLLSPWVFDFAASMFSWYHGERVLGGTDLLFGFLIAFVLMAACTLISLGKKSKKQLHEIVSPGGYPDTVDKPSGKLSVIFAVLFALVTMATLVIPVEYAYICAVIMVLLGVMIIYTTFPLVLFGASSLLMRCKLQRTPSLLLAQKSIKNGKSPKHIGRLTVVLLSLLVTVVLCGNAVQGQVDLLEHAVTGDVVAVGMPHQLQEQLQKEEHVAYVADLSYYASAELNGRYTVMAISVGGDVQQCLDPEIVPKRPLQAGQVAISKGLAALCDINTGETIHLSCDGNEYDFEVAEITDSKINLVVANTASFKNSVDISVLSLSDSALYAETVSRLESEGVFVVEESVFDLSGIDTLRGFVSLIKATFFSALVVCALGLINMLLQQRKNRAHERNILSLSGMTGKQRVWMSAWELLSLLAISLVCSLFLGYALFAIINIGAGSFGMAFL